MEPWASLPVPREGRLQSGYGSLVIWLHRALLGAYEFRGLSEPRALDEVPHTLLVPTGVSRAVGDC